MLCHDLLNGAILVQLLPRAAYSVRDPSHLHTLGITLERQKGIHAVDSDRRMGFDTFPGVLAQTPVGVDVFSESMIGGEYLLLRLDGSFAQLHLPALNHRVQSAGNSKALGLAQKMRRLLLAANTDQMALEQAALSLVELASQANDRPQKITSTAFKDVLDQIAESYAQPLQLKHLADTYGRNELGLLRDFSLALGITPHAYLIETRLQAARSLIDSTDLPLATIALEAGFAHQSHMGSAFRLRLGMTPKEYRCR